MKTLFSLFISIFVFSVTSVSIVKAQVSITANATAEVIKALTAKEESQLNFGRFSPETQGGKVILTPDGVRTAQGTVILGNGAHNAASFYITGEYDATFSVSLPSGPALLTNILNSKTMQVSDWQSYPAPGIGVGKLNGGEMKVQIGAVLTVGTMTENPVGIYAGIYAITFVYN